MVAQNYTSGIEGSMDVLQPLDTKKTKGKWSFFGIGVFLGALIGLSLFFGLYFGLPPQTEVGIPDTTTIIITTTNKDTKHPSSATYNNAAVAADAGQCSQIGVEILKKGGSVVDSAIAAMLCVGLHNSHSCGIGGGFFMTIYNHTTGEATFVNSREVAAIKAEQNMFKENPTKAVLGGLAVGVPGEISGYWEAHQSYGKLPWEEVVAPAIDMAENGFVVQQALASAIHGQADLIKNRTFNLWPIFENDDGTLKEEGDIIRLPLLAKTLKTISKEGRDAFYSGKLADDIISDIEDGYGEHIITKDDLLQYETQIRPAINISIDDLTIFSPPPPASGAVMSLIVNILDGYDFAPEDLTNKNKVLTYHRIVEAFRFAYAKRSLLGDDRNNPIINEVVKNLTSDAYADGLRLKINDDHTWPVEYYDPDWSLPNDKGTAHLSVIGPNGDAVGVTSTVNLHFGSKVRGKRTGIIFNNEMDDFSTPNVTNSFGVPPSPNNFIVPGNRPMSSMTPAIVVDNSVSPPKVKMVAGASGGTKITTSTAMVLMNSLWFGLDAGPAVEMKRIHDQLMPNYTQCEVGIDEMIVEGLRDKGHEVDMIQSAGSVVQAILVREDGKLSAASDTRKGGFPDGY